MLFRLERILLESSMNGSLSEVCTCGDICCGASNVDQETAEPALCHTPLPQFCSAQQQGLLFRSGGLRCLSSSICLRSCCVCSCSALVQRLQPGFAPEQQGDILLHLRIIIAQTVLLLERPNQRCLLRNCFLCIQQQERSGPCRCVRWQPAATGVGHTQICLQPDL